LAVIFSDFDIRKFEIISVVGRFEIFEDIFIAITHPNP
jgi:hypothetical protein